MVVQSKGSIRGGCRHDGVCSGRFVLLIGCVVKVQDGVSPGDAEKTWGKKGRLARGWLYTVPTSLYHWRHIFQGWEVSELPTSMSSRGRSALTVLSVSQVVFLLPPRKKAYGLGCN